MRVLLFVGLSAGLAAQTTEVRALLQKRCLACHGPSQQMSGLRLDDREAGLKGGYSGPAILPGKSGESRLIERVLSTKEGFSMPPSGARLTAAEVETLKQWIDRGAEWPFASVAKANNAKLSHWAFQPVRRPTVPPGVHPVDALVRAKLSALSLPPSPEAAKPTLARRVSLDLRGIPPSPAEMREYLDDARPDAYERMVDRFLASPHFGEKWARHWLDLARYADSDGYEKDQPRPNAFRWRNWVIDAYNRDLPFDRFTIEQIAGDLLPGASTETRVATGFHRNTLINREAGVSRAEDRFEQTINRTNTISTTWLGLTAGCAQCHDHTYDPISQREYYQLFAFMNAIQEEDIEAPLPGELGPWLASRAGYLKERDALLAEYQISQLQLVWEERMRAAITKPGTNVEWDFALTSCTAMLDNAQAMLMTPADKRTEYQRERLLNYFVYNMGPDNNRDKELMAKIRTLREKMNALNGRTPQITLAHTVAEAPQPVKTTVAVRGDYKRPGIEVQPDTLAVLPPMGKAGPARLEFAKWLVSRDNPLTARVIMNRTWQEFFGRGLVRTSEDFGLQGEKPSHPELLDYLASEFIERGWSQKQMMRLIVTSATYKQSSQVRPDLVQRDPDNTLLARQSRLRLSAEGLRDSALAASGLLDERIGGPSIRPPQPPGVAELQYGNNKWRESTGADRYRRGLYIHFQRTAPYPQLMTFDAPESTVACSRRRTSNTPLQSLNLLNDPVFVEAAQALAYRVSGLPTDEARIAAAFETALNRPPSAREMSRLMRLRQEQSLLAVARVILNLDEFVTRE